MPGAAFPGMRARCLNTAIVPGGTATVCGFRIGVVSVPSGKRARVQNWTGLGPVGPTESVITYSTRSPGATTTGAGIPWA